jgi:SAM-dependent methyltransferase
LEDAVLYTSLFQEDALLSKAGEDAYTDGSYLDKTGGTWHLEDSPFKARQIVRMLSRHPELGPGTVCEIGCGAGGILSELQKVLPNNVTFTGYEISPQAHAISTTFSNNQCRYILGDAFADSASYDLVLVMDVVEHVEDCFSFLRQTKKKGRWKLYQIPLETHASAVLRGVNAHMWDDVGHIHLFTIETALRSVERTGHRVVDWILTPGMLAKPRKNLLNHLANLVRVPLMKLNPRLAVRLVGGYSILILAE